jgi:hypothetical protein
MAHATLSDMDTRKTDETASLKSLRTYARNKGVEEELVVTIYEQEITELDHRAKVKMYLPLLAEKRTRNRIKAF